jgi:hypothetical protein
MFLVTLNQIQMKLYWRIILLKYTENGVLISYCCLIVDWAIDWAIVKNSYAASIWKWLWLYINSNELDFLIITIYYKVVCNILIWYWSPFATN